MRGKYSGIAFSHKKNNVLKCASTGMNLDISQIQKDRYRMISFNMKYLE